MIRFSITALLANKCVKLLKRELPIIIKNATQPDVGITPIIVRKEPP